MPPFRVRRSGAERGCGAVPFILETVSIGAVPMNAPAVPSSSVCSHA